MRLKVDRMSEFNNYRLILEELEHTLSHVDDTDYERFTNDVIGADRIFVAGKGRSGFVANSFAMRLNQLGEDAFVVGNQQHHLLKNMIYLLLFQDQVQLST